MADTTNKHIVRRWFDAVNQADEAAILTLLSQDFVFKSMARSPSWLIHRWNGQTFAAAPKAMAPLLKTPIILNIAGMIGEGDEVAVEADTDVELINGKRYNNAYHFVFVLQDGLIAEVREYCCSFLVEECFGEFDPNNPRSSRAAVEARA